MGVTLDSEFKWLPHLDNVQKKIARNVYLLSQLKNYADVNALKVFYYGHILPHISYASPVWDGCANEYLKKLNSLQRRAAKLILNNPDCDTE